MDDLSSSSYLTWDLDDLILMAINERCYLAYMLRIWQTIDTGKLDWRASLEDPHTHERIGFTNLEALIIYLRELAYRDQVKEEAVIHNDELAE